MLNTESHSSETCRTPAKSDGGNRVWPATVLYLAMMEALEARRVELNISMAVVDDMAGLQDGFFSKMINPNSPTGRQSRWETIQDVADALFGRGFEVNISITPCEGPNRVLASSLCRPKHPSANQPKNRHWRHRKYFVELGKKGAKARKEKFEAMTEEERKRAVKHIVRKARATRRKNKLIRAQAAQATPKSKPLQNGPRPCVVTTASAGASSLNGIGAPAE